MYKVVIIGAGRIGAMFDRPGEKQILSHAHGFSEASGFQLKGFYDADPGKAEAAAKRWKAQAFSDMESAMRDTDVVCCCVPDAYHYSVLKELRNYPLKLVIAEKPLAQTLEEALELENLYAGLPCLVNYSRRFLREFWQLREEIPQYGRFLKGVGYYGKGILHNGSHMIDLLCYLFGEIRDFGSPKHKLYDFWEEDASCDVSLYIEDGVFYMNAVDCSAVTVFELDLLFEKARVRILDGGMKIEKYRVQKSPVFEGYYNYVQTEKERVDYSNAILGMVANAEQYLKKKEPLKCTLSDGRRVLEYCLKIRGEID